jgi:3-oxoacyl-[acyl-carrier-protein] synthase II
MTRTRVVITGLGAVTALGSSIEKLWDGLVNGNSGIRRITLFDPAGLPCQIAGEIPDFNIKDYMPLKEARRQSRSGQIGFAAATQAIEDAGFIGIVPEPERSGVIFGTAMGGLERLVDGIDVYRDKGLERVNPFVLPSGIPNISAFLISQKYQCLGPNSTIVTACATGTQTIGEGAEQIRRGLADVMIVGGTEALMRDFSIVGFAAMRALPTNYNNDPSRASRPFDANREGFVFSEGAAAMVLENLEHAEARGANIHAEVVGYASSTDGYHIAAPQPDGEGAIRTMKWAIRNAEISPDDIDYINAHGSSTPLNDTIETNAIKTVFGDRAYQIPVNSTKSMLGHAMGASGTLEAIACTLQIKHGMLHPTINYETPDPDCDLDYVPNQARDFKINTAMSNSFGLGGQNACLIIKRYHGNHS